MKRKERKLLLRVVNSISSIVLLFSCIYLFFWGLSIAAVSGAVLALCCICGPVALAGEGALEIFLGVAEAFLHAIVDAVIGIFEAIGNALSGID